MPRAIDPVVRRQTLAEVLPGPLANRAIMHILPKTGMEI